VELTLSPQIKIVALVGLLATLALGGGMLFLGRSQSSSGSAAPSTPLKHYHRVTTTAATPTSKHAGRHAVASKPAAKPAVKTAKPATKPVVKTAAPATPTPVHSSTPAVAANGLPTALDVLLHTHRIVVVSLYDPEAPADAIAFAEARAGAADASAGFLGVNVLDERISAPLTALVGGGTVLPDPGILVFRRPGTLMNRITGFADRGAVAQLVAAALLADPPPAPAPAPATTPAAPAP
jgi:hypothetical protein